MEEKLLKPKIEILDELEITYDSQVEDLITPKQEIDTSDSHQQTVNMLKPIQIESILSSEIVELQNLEMKKEKSEEGDTTFNTTDVCGCMRTGIKPEPNETEENLSTDSAQRIGDSSNPSTTPSSTQKQTDNPSTICGHRKRKLKTVSGYIMFSSKLRQTIMSNATKSTFGDISRLVGHEWRILPDAEKQTWKDLAVKFNEKAARLAEENSNVANPVSCDETRSKSNYSTQQSRKPEPNEAEAILSTVGAQTIGDSSNPSMTPSLIQKQTGNPSPTQHVRKRKLKTVTGYIMFSRKYRKIIASNATNLTKCKSTFGDISRLVGHEWRILPGIEKQTWNDLAAKFNEETAKSEKDKSKLTYSNSKEEKNECIGLERMTTN